MKTTTILLRQDMLFCGYTSIWRVRIPIISSDAGYDLMSEGHTAVANSWRRQMLEAWRWRFDVGVGLIKILKTILKKVISIAPIKNAGTVTKNAIRCRRGRPSARLSPLDSCFKGMLSCAKD
jgi:hypothetical protein